MPAEKLSRSPLQFLRRLCHDRQLTRFDLPDLKNAIEQMEDEVDELEAQLKGRRPRKAFGIVPRDW